MWNLLGWKSFSPGLLTLLAIWSVFWKGLALWRSARKTSKYWFVALLVINTLGILEILYLFVFSKPEKESQQLTANDQLKAAKGHDAKKQDRKESENKKKTARNKK